LPDFAQAGRITTLHELGTVDNAELERMLCDASQSYRIGLLLPITADDMRAPPFAQIVQQLVRAEFLDTVVVVLNRAPEVQDYRDTRQVLAPLGKLAHVLWTDGARGSALHRQLNEAGFNLAVPGKGRAVWTGFGYLLADARLNAFVLHDCDIVDYGLDMLIRLCLPMAHTSLDFDFCKAYYARCTDRMHGRVARLLVMPLVQALLSVLGHDGFLEFMASFRYPLAGEFAVTSTLARSNRIPCDWGLEVGTLAEVYRNTSPKRVCQVDLGRHYEHKHQSLSLDAPDQGLMKMAGDILSSIFRTLASRGVVFHPGHFVSLHSTYLRMAQDAIRKYHADALINSLKNDRHAEEQAVEAFAALIMTSGKTFLENPAGGESIPNWARVLAAFPEFPQRLREAVAQDAEEFGG
jgi:glucosyl-3-phosphoglycerate synthase